MPRSGAIGLVACQHRPGDACSLVGLGHGGNVAVFAGGQVHQPAAAVIGFVGSRAQYATGTVYQQPAQVAVATFVDPK